jgi:2-keto-3-deoxy-L-rhamnonate aldolase RhmA
MDKLRAKLADGRPAFGMFVSLESPSISEIAAELGVDWLVVDLEHGHLGYKDVLEHQRAVRGSGTTVLVRVPIAAQDTIKRVLDLGADGVVVPLPLSAADVERAAAWARYPSAGERGVGSDRAVRWGLNPAYLAQANDSVLVVPIIETREAVASVEDIMKVEGLRVMFVGPADLSARYGYLGQWEGPGVDKTVLDVKDRARANGIACGIMSLDAADAVRRRDQGFQLIGIGSDAGLLVRSLRAALQELQS